MDVINALSKSFAFIEGSCSTKLSRGERRINRREAIAFVFLGNFRLTVGVFLGVVAGSDIFPPVFIFPKELSQFKTFFCLMQ